MGDFGTAILIVAMAVALSVMWSGILWISGFGTSIFHVLRWINSGVTLFVGHAFIEASAGYQFNNFAIAPVWKVLCFSVLLLITALCFRRANAIDDAAAKDFHAAVRRQIEWSQEIERWKDR